MKVELVVNKGGKISIEWCSLAGCAPPQDYEPGTYSFTLYEGDYGIFYAKANEGYEFDRWSVDIFSNSTLMDSYDETSTDIVIQYQEGADKIAVTAYFKALEQPVTCPEGTTRMDTELCASMPNCWCVQYIDGECCCRCCTTRTDPPVEGVEVLQIGADGSTKTMMTDEDGCINPDSGRYWLIATKQEDGHMLFSLEGYSEKPPSRLKLKEVTEVTVGITFGVDPAKLLQIAMNATQNPILAPVIQFFRTGVDPLIATFLKWRLDQELRARNVRNVEVTAVEVKNDVVTAYLTSKVRSPVDLISAIVIIAALLAIVYAVMTQVANVFIAKEKEAEHKNEEVALQTVAKHYDYCRKLADACMQEGGSPEECERQYERCVNNARSLYKNITNKEAPSPEEIPAMITGVVNVIPALIGAAILIPVIGLIRDLLQRRR